MSNLDKQHAMHNEHEPAEKHGGEVVDIGNDLATILKDRPIKTWGRGSLHLYAVCLLVYLCSTMNGYDGSLMGSINAVPSYTKYYNLPKKGNSGTGIVFAIFQVGQMTGALFSWVSDWRGRRWPIFVGCFGTCIGAIVTSVAPTIPAFIGGRFLLAFFSTIATTAAPLYLIEIAPPQYRGTIAGMYNTLYYLASGLFQHDTLLLIMSAGLNHRNVDRLRSSKALG
ncbi:hypothetical protein ACEQ8H_008881 [Pleosporales sp. CAS-2024a]